LIPRIIRVEAGWLSEVQNKFELIQRLALIELNKSERTVEPDSRNAVWKILVFQHARVLSRQQLPVRTEDLNIHAAARKLRHLGIFELSGSEVVRSLESRKLALCSIERCDIEISIQAPERLSV
jgi:hypothetical protein